MTLDDVLKELRNLNEPVPKPRRLPTTTEVEVAEQRLGVTFHPDYRTYLLAASDVVVGTKEPCTLTPGSHTDLLTTASNAWRQVGVPRDLLPICEDSGDFHCMNHSGEVVFWSHDGASDEHWPDLATWIKTVWIDGK
jgi:hypothetical protein